MKPAYYNEHDPYAAQWLRNLIAAGHIAPGDVDERSILDVRADDLKGYAQCHFFAGIGGWSLALRLAGWGDDRSVWTGSCPCQPFSAAGAGKAADDERHLWPEWFRLIDACRPPIIFGEQVASAAVIGKSGEAADLCDGESQTKPRLRTDTPRENQSEEKGNRLRSGLLFDGDSEANRQRFVRSDGIAIELGWWSDLGQPVARSHRLEGALSLLKHQDRLPCSEQRNGGLGRAAHGADRAGSSGETQGEIERIIEAIAREFEITPEWPWLDIVRSDLERARYTLGTQVLPACGVGAPHIRQRLWFVADAMRDRTGPTARNGREPKSSSVKINGSASGAGAAARIRSTYGRELGDAAINRSGALDGQSITSARRQEPLGGSSLSGELGNAGSPRLQERERDGRVQREAMEPPAREAIERGGDIGDLADAERRPAKRRRHDLAGEAGCAESQAWEWQRLRDDTGTSGVLNGFWSDAEWIACTDGKARPVGPGSFPLGHGIRNRTSKLRAYGNAIVPQTAAEFIKAASRARELTP